MNQAQIILKDVLKLEDEPCLNDDGSAYWFLGEESYLKSLGPNMTARLGGIYKITVELYPHE